MFNFPQFTLGSSTSSDSEDEGIREDYIKVQNGIVLSSSTLNDHIVSLNASQESILFNEKNFWTPQTFNQDEFSNYPKFPHRRDSFITLNTSTYHLEIPPIKSSKKLSRSKFHLEIRPCRKKMNLATSKTCSNFIKGQVNVLETCGTQAPKIYPELTIQKVVSEDIFQNFTFTTSTFHEEIVFEQLPSGMSTRLSKLGEELVSFQAVFTNFNFEQPPVGRILKWSLDKDTQNEMDVSISTSNSQTQTISIGDTCNNIQFLFSKVEAMNLECEFNRACGHMIKRCPFYYEFIDKCYTEPEFDCYGKFRHLKPKESNFKKAVIDMATSDENFLTTINSVLKKFKAKKKNNVNN